MCSTTDNRGAAPSCRCPSERTSMSTRSCSAKKSDTCRSSENSKRVARRGPGRARVDRNRYALLNRQRLRRQRVLRDAAGAGSRHRRDGIAAVDGIPAALCRRLVRRRGIVAGGRRDHLAGAGVAQRHVEAELQDRVFGAGRAGHAREAARERAARGSRRGRRDRSDGRCPLGRRVGHGDELQVARQRVGDVQIGDGLADRHVNRDGVCRGKFGPVAVSSSGPT